MFFSEYFTISRAKNIVFFFNIYTKDFIDRGSLYRGSTVNISRLIPFHNHLLIKVVTIKNFTLANNNVQQFDIYSQRGILMNFNL